MVAEQLAQVMPLTGISILRGRDAIAQVADQGADLRLVRHGRVVGHAGLLAGQVHRRLATPGIFFRLRSMVVEQLAQVMPVMGKVTCFVSLI